MTAMLPPGVGVAVADRGDGIPGEHLPRLTERFYRVDTARSRELGGTGLGLAIVKHILNRHRGRLEIDSTIGEGSTFTVWLRAADRRPSDAAVRTDRVSGTCHQNCNRTVIALYRGPGRKQPVDPPLGVR